jgi:hypothetical protein
MEDLEIVATRMKPEEEGGGETDVPKVAWTRS